MSADHSGASAGKKQVRKVAIACQGGGSHAAFTAGVLKGILTSDGEGFKYGEDFIVTALTGTSGGAVCAGLVWSWLQRQNQRLDLDSEQSRAARAATKLVAFWEDLACTNFGTDLGEVGKVAIPQVRDAFDLFDSIGNFALVGFLRMIPGFEANCRIASDIACHRMRELLGRHMNDELATFQPADRCNPFLRIGATNIMEGWSRPLCGELVDVFDAIVASASIPPLYGPYPLKNDVFWDGLFSHNPPIDCLTNLKNEVRFARDRSDKHNEIPDEIWVIQINPTQCKRVPTTSSDLIDRRNELSGNLALQAELYHIDATNYLLKNEPDPNDTPERKETRAAVQKALTELGYKPIELRVVCLDEDLDYPSKLERSRGHVQRLITRGEKKASEFGQKSSIWTCPESGLDMAARKSADGVAASSPTWCSNVACPSVVLCNSIPAIRETAVRVFDDAQQSLDRSADLAKSH